MSYLIDKLFEYDFTLCVTFTVACCVWIIYNMWNKED